MPDPTINERTLIEKVKTDKDSEALSVLVDLHSGIYMTVAAKYAATYPNLISINDIKDDRMFNIYRFILAYEGDRDMKLGTYIGERTDFMCRTALKKGRVDPLKHIVTRGTFHTSESPGSSWNREQQFTEIAADVQLSDQTNPDQETLAERDLSIEEIRRAARRVPDRRFAEIIEDRFFTSPSPLTWRQIGIKLGITHEGVRKIYCKGIEKIRKGLKEN